MTEAGETEMQSAFAACEAAVKRADPDRYLSALFAPAEKRPLLFALYAFNHQLARIGEIVHEPAMGQIRLQWWREAVESAHRGDPPAHDVGRALAAAFARSGLPLELFEATIDARAADLERAPFSDLAALETYADSTSGNLMRLAARALGAGATHDDLAHEAGIAYGLAGLLRSQAFHAARNKFFVSDAEAAKRVAMEHFARVRTLPKPRGAIAAFLPATLAPLYLRDPAKEVPLYRKQIAMFFAGSRGRV